MNLVQKVCHRGLRSGRSATVLMEELQQSQQRSCGTNRVGLAQASSQFQAAGLYPQIPPQLGPTAGWCLPNQNNSPHSHFAGMPTFAIFPQAAFKQQAVSMGSHVDGVGLTKTTTTISYVRPCPLPLDATQQVFPQGMNKGLNRVTEEYSRCQQPAVSPPQFRIVCLLLHPKQRELWLWRRLGTPQQKQLQRMLVLQSQWGRQPSRQENESSFRVNRQLSFVNLSFRS